MKKLLRLTFGITIFIVIASLLSGCQWLNDLRASILKKTDDTVTQVNTSIENTAAQLKKAKEAVDKKVQELQDAAKKVNDAVDAVKKVTQ